MISPTGYGIRNDSEGFGHYGASRGTHHHKGTDYLADYKQPIVAPFDMILQRYANPSTKFPLESGVKWATKTCSGKMFYFIPIPELIKTYVNAGQIIGKAMDLTPYYGSDILNHIHFEIDSFDPEFFIQLTNLITKFQI